MSLLISLGNLLNLRKMSNLESKTQSEASPTGSQSKTVKILDKGKHQEDTIVDVAGPSRLSPNQEPSPLSCDGNLSLMMILSFSFMFFDHFVSLVCFLSRWSTSQAPDYRRSTVSSCSERRLESSESYNR